MYNKSYLIVVIFILAVASIAAADTITTPVRFVIPTAMTFTLSIPAGNGTIFNVTQTTTTIIFNTTDATAVKLNATNSPGGSAMQDSGTAIFNYTNTGNIKINITAVFSTALASGITVKAGWADGGYEATCSQANLTNTAACSKINDNGNTNQTRIANLSTSGAGSWRSVWLWADFSSVAIGTDSTVNLAHTSVAG